MSNDASLQKRCCTCGETKPIELFSKNKTEKDGRQKRCKVCVSRHYAANAEAVCAHVRDYSEKNAEVIRERRRGYNITNVATRQAYRERNAEKIREYKQDYRKKNAEELRKKQRDYSAANPEKVKMSKRIDRIANSDTNRAIAHRRRARIKGNGGSYTRAEIKAMRIAQAGICAYCCYQYDPDALTIDHIIPIDQGGTNDISNICLACPRCNSNKSNKTPEQWVNRWYLLKD